MELSRSEAETEASRQKRSKEEAVGGRRRRRLLSSVLDDLRQGEQESDHGEDAAAAAESALPSIDHAKMDLFPFSLLTGSHFPAAAGDVPVPDHVVEGGNDHVGIIDAADSSSAAAAALCGTPEALSGQWIDPISPF